MPLLHKMLEDLFWTFIRNKTAQRLPWPTSQLREWYTLLASIDMMKLVGLVAAVRIEQRYCDCLSENWTWRISADNANVINVKQIQNEKLAQELCFMKRECQSVFVACLQNKVKSSKLQSLYFFRCCLSIHCAHLALHVFLHFRRGSDLKEVHELSVS